jgi:hypothetical protein
MKRTNGEEFRLAARRALALGYAALDRPTVAAVREARRLVVRVLSLIDQQLCGGEIGELVKALRAMSTELTGLEARTV